MVIMEEIVHKLPKYQQAAESLREIILANLVMIGEIPSPTFDEARRVELLQNRFVECGLQNCSSDEAGNALAVLPGKGSEDGGSILITAHLDTIFENEVDHTLLVQADRITGPGVADNSLGLAILAS